MPSIAEMVITVGLVTQFLKTALAKVNVVVEKTAAVVLSVVVSCGVVAYYWILSGDAFNIGLIALVIQVAIGANAGYGLLKVARSK